LIKYDYESDAHKLKRISNSVINFG